MNKQLLREKGLSEAARDKCASCGGNVKVVGNTTKHYYNTDRGKVEQLESKIEYLRAQITLKNARIKELRKKNENDY